MNCTNQENGIKYVKQKFYFCYTCDPSLNLGVCSVCAKKCHEGHNISPEYFGLFFCDCGIGAFKNCPECKCYTPTDRDSNIRTLTRKTTDIPIAMQIPFIGINGITSPHTTFLCLGLLAKIYNCSDVTRSLTGGNDILLLYSDNIPGIRTALGIFGTNKKTDNLIQDSDLDIYVDPENTAKKVNSFVASRTENMIPQLLDRDPEQDVITCVSAIHFNMSWKHKFDETLTREMQFKGTNGNVKVQMMEESPMNDALCIIDSVFSTIVLEYAKHSSQDEPVFAVLTIPTNKSGIQIRDLIKSNTELYKKHLLLRNMHRGNVLVRIPKFKKEFNYPNFQDNLSSLGLDFDTLRKHTGVDEIIHKVVIDLNEKGTEAAAACVSVSRGCPTFDYEWIGDVPYSIAIMYRNDPNKNGTILFYGVIDHSV